MPRTARQLSASGIYHVTVRGVNKMDIFYDTVDRLKLLSAIKESKLDKEFFLYAYCLMDNHIHLVIKANKDPLDRSMKRILLRYVIYYNKKYDRIGPLFQDRYASQPIDDEDYFLVCTSYVHRNPVKAGLVRNAENYPWSSYRDYLNPDKPNEVLDRDFLYNTFNPNILLAVRMLKEFTEAADLESVQFQEFENPKAIQNKLNRDLTLQIIKRTLDNYGVSLDNFSNLAIEDRKYILHDIVENIELSGRELAKILGISRKAVYMARNKDRISTP